MNKFFPSLLLSLGIMTLAGCETKTDECFADAVAFDAALSWVSSPGNFVGCPDSYNGNTYRYVTDLIDATGVKHIRERLKWRETAPEPDSLTLGRYLDNAEYFRQKGIGISDVFHDAPSYTLPKPDLPRDLVALYDYCRQCAETFGPRVEQWEYWNEEDISFAAEGAWEYAAGLKAASLGWRDGGFKGWVTNGAICRDDWDFYNETLFRNDPQPYIDVFNTHFYTGPCSYQRRMKETREFLTRFGIGDMYVVLTECGTRQDGNTLLPSVMEGFARHSSDQENVQREFCIKSQVLSRMEGIRRNYFFIFGAYSEQNGTKDWGLLRRDGTTKPAVDAYAEMLREVGEGTLAGEVAVEGEGVRAFRFDMPHGVTKLMYWTVSNIDLWEAPTEVWSDEPTKASVRLDDGSQFTLTASRFARYATLPASLPVRREALPTGVVGVPETPDKDSRVILRADFNTDDCRLGAAKSRIELNGDSVRLSLEVWNLDDQPKVGTLHLTASGRLEGLPKDVSLPARGKTVLPLIYYPDGAVDAAITIEGNFGGRYTTAFHVPVFCESADAFAKMMASGQSLELGWRDVTRWEKNASSEQQITWDETEDAIRIDTEWQPGSRGEGDRWAFPRLMLQLPEESLTKARLLTFETKSTQDKVENDYSSARVYFVTPDKKTDLLVTPPGDDYEVRRVEIPASQREGALGLEFGGHPLGHRHTMWIRNIRIYKVAD